MGIDLFTVAAQVVNFLVLVALLKRFLYGPVIRAMDAREERVASRLDEAADARAAAEAEAERLRASTAELEGARERLLAEARAEVDERRRELLTDAREEVQRQRERWHDAVEREKQTLHEELERRTLERVYSIARRALKDLADGDLERAVAQAFLRRLAELEPEVWARAAEQDDGPRSFQVASAFELPADVRTAIVERVRERAGEDAVVRFEVEPETIAGVELRTHGLRVSWSLGDFVDSLEDPFAATAPALAPEVPR